MDTVSIIDQNQPHVVFIPFPAQSHIKCMLKLATILQQKGFHITFVNTEYNHNRLLKYGGFQDFDGVPDFQFKSVPDRLSSTSDDDHGATQSLLKTMGFLTTNFLASFLEIVAGLKTPVTCIISDGFMTFAKTPEAAEKLGVPIILFWTMAACGFMGFYQAKVLMEKGVLPLKDESYLTNGYLDTLIDIPGMKDIRLRDLPDHIMGVGRRTWAFKYILEMLKVADQVPHMIIHTFNELESSLMEELKSKFPRVYTIGPLQLLLNKMTEKETKNSAFNGYSLWKEEPECFQWLHTKEPNSVVYVNFGSLAVMSSTDLVELGWGLVNSNHHFLWIIRDDLVDGGPVVLPEDLEEMVKERGFIGSWCSQEEVLNHSSVGGFLTHGGWGSVIESLSAGVPMICCPFTGDQKTNCRQLCKEWDVGMEIGRDDVKRDEVEKLVRELMEGGKRRNKAMEWRKMAEDSTGSNGSSFLDIEKLVNDISVFSRN